VALLAFSALCVYSKFGHHPHPLGHLCAKPASERVQLSVTAGCDRRLVHDSYTPLPRLWCHSIVKRRSNTTPRTFICSAAGRLTPQTDTNNTVDTAAYSCVGVLTVSTSDISGLRRRPFCKYHWYTQQTQRGPLWVFLGSSYVCLFWQNTDVSQTDRQNCCS